MLEQIKLDACYLFEVERSDKDDVKYAMVMYLLIIIAVTAILGIVGLVSLFVIEWSRAKKKTTNAPVSGQPTSQSRSNRKD